MQLWRASALIWAVGVEARLQPQVAATSRRRIDAATHLRGGFGGALLESYTNLLAKAPLRTNMVTAACLAMKNPSGALSDATRAVAIEPEWAKARYIHTLLHSHLTFTPLSELYD